MELTLISKQQEFKAINKNFQNQLMLGLTFSTLLDIFNRSGEFLTSYIFKFVAKKIKKKDKSIARGEIAEMYCCQYPWRLPEVLGFCNQSKTDGPKYKRFLQYKIYVSFTQDPTAELEKKFLQVVTKDKTVLPRRMYVNTRLLHALLCLRIEMAFPMSKKNYFKTKGELHWFLFLFLVELLHKALICSQNISRIN